MFVKLSAGWFLNLDTVYEVLQQPNTEAGKTQVRVRALDLDEDDQPTQMNYYMTGEAAERLLVAMEILAGPVVED